MARNLRALELGIKTRRLEIEGHALTAEALLLEAEVSFESCNSWRGHEERVWHVAWRPASSRCGDRMCRGLLLRPILASSGRHLSLVALEAEAVTSPSGSGDAGPVAPGANGIFLGCRASKEWHLLQEVDASDHHSRTLRALAARSGTLATSHVHLLHGQWDVNGAKLAVASFDASISVWRVTDSQGPGPCARPRRLEASSWNASPYSAATRMR